MRRTVIVLAALALLALAGAASLSTVEAPARPVVPRKAVTSAPTQPERVSETGNEDETEASAQPADAAEASAAEDDGWMLCGKVEYAAYQGIDPHSAMTAWERKVEITWLDFNAAEDRLATAEFDPGPHGEFKESWDPEADPANFGFFVAPCSWLRDPNPLRQFYNAETLPPRETIQGLHTPRINGRRIDFGVIRVDFEALPQPPWIFKGRMLHASGAPVARQWNHSIQLYNHTPAPDWDWYPEAGADGRFMEFVSAGWMEPPQGQWRLKSEYFNREVLTPLQPPSIEGRIADFGDVVVPGALLEVRVEVNGSESTLPVDLTLDKVEAVQTSSRGLENFSIEGATMLVLPPGRYEWEAELDSNGLFARPVKGELSLGDEKTLLRIQLVLAQHIPVRVMTPLGEETDYSVQWHVDSPQEAATHWWGHGDKGRHRVPVEQGSTTLTRVWADFLVEDTQYTKICGEGAARFGEAELVIRLELPAAGPFRLEVVVPRAPPELYALQREAIVAVAVGDDVEELLAWQPVELSADHEVVRVFHLSEGREVEVWLEGGELVGFMDGRMTASAAIAFSTKRHARVTLPKIAAPPWNARAKHLASRFSCGGTDIALTGSFGGYRRAAQGWFHSDWGISLERDGNRRGIRLPDCLLDNGRKIPLRVIPPDNGLAKLVLELPPCVVVRLSINGHDVRDFSAEIDTGGAVPTRCRGYTSDGACNLWAPAGHAELRVWADGEQIKLPPADRVVKVPASGSIEIKLGNLARVEFPRPDGRNEDDAAQWEMFLLDRPPDPGAYNRVGWGDVKQLPAGRYLLVPQLPEDQTAAFEVEIKGNRAIALPALTPLEKVDVLLRLPFAMGHLRKCEVEYFMAGGKAAQTWTFSRTGAQADVEETPEGVRIKGLPAGRTIVLRGRVDWTKDEDHTWNLLRPIVFDPGERQNIEAVLDPAVEASQIHHGLAGDVAVLSDLPGCALRWTYDGYLRPGRHEIVVFDESSKELFRMWVDVPDTEELDLEQMPALHARLKQNGLLE